MTTTEKRKKTPREKNKPSPDAKHKALVDSLCGLMSWMSFSVDDYLREKHAEVDSKMASEIYP